MAAQHTKEVYEAGLRVPVQLAEARNNLITDLAKIQQQTIESSLKILGIENTSFQTQINAALESGARSTIEVSVIDRELLTEGEKLEPSVAEQVTATGQFPIYFSNEELSSVLFSLRSLIFHSLMYSEASALKAELAVDWNNLQPQLPVEFQQLEATALVDNKSLIDFLKKDPQHRNDYAELESRVGLLINPHLGENITNPYHDFMEHVARNRSPDAIRELRAKLEMITDYRQLAIEENIPATAVSVSDFYSQNILPNRTVNFSTVSESIVEQALREDSPANVISIRSDWSNTPSNVDVNIEEIIAYMQNIYGAYRWKSMRGLAKAYSDNGNLKGFGAE